MKSRILHAKSPTSRGVDLGQRVIDRLPQNLAGEILTLDARPPYFEIAEFYGRTDIVDLVFKINGIRDPLEWTPGDVLVLPETRALDQITAQTRETDTALNREIQEAGQNMLENTGQQPPNLRTTQDPVPEISETQIRVQPPRNSQITERREKILKQAQTRIDQQRGERTPLSQALTKTLECDDESSS